jgi:hypothetical protein
LIDESVGLPVVGRPFSYAAGMFDNNWDLINGEDAHGIEVLNQSSVANLIEALVRYFQHHDTTPGEACSLNPGEYVLRELHRSGTLLLLERPGAYRDLQVQVGRRDGFPVIGPAAMPPFAFWSVLRDSGRRGPRPRP